MIRVLIYSGIFLGGVYIGVQLCKATVKSKTQTALDDALGKLGLGGGAIQDFADNILIPGLVS